MKRFKNLISWHKLLTLAILLGLLFAFGCSKKKPPEAITIAIVAPLTGDGAVYGEPQRKAAELCVERINQQGGLIGRKLVLVPYDDRAQPTEAVNVAHILVAKKGIAGVLGHPNSGNAIAASKIYNQKGLTYIATSPTNPVLTAQGYDNVFRFAPTDDMQGVSAAEFILKRLQIDSIVILHDNASYGKGLAEGVKKHYETLGGKVVLFDALIPAERDYRSILLKASKHEPKAVFYGGMMPEGSLLVRQAQELGLNTQFVFGDGCFDEKFKELAGTDCRNVYVSFLAPPWETVPTAKSFVEEYWKLYGSIPPFAPYGYDAAKVLAEAIKKANSSAKEKIIQALRDPTFVVEGVTGEIRFDPNGQAVDRRFYFYTFSNQGKLVIYE